MKITVNIGLNIPNTQGTGTIGAGFAARGIETLGTIASMKLQTVTHAQGIEQTLIVQLYAKTHGQYGNGQKWVRERISDIARVLKQDCIAVWFDGPDDYGHGELIGPNAAKWGDFNSTFFTFID